MLWEFLELKTDFAFFGLVLPLVLPLRPPLTWILASLAKVFFFLSVGDLAGDFFIVGDLEIVDDFFNVGDLAGDFLNVGDLDGESGYLIKLVFRKYCELSDC